MGTQPGLSHGSDRPAQEVTLPALARTVGTSLAGELVIVAHSGRTHVAVTVDRRFVRGLEEALAQVRAAPAAGVPLDDRRPGAGVEIPDEVPFRSATDHVFTVSGRDVHVVLHAPGGPGEPGTSVELRLDRALLRRVEQHRNRDRVKHDLLLGTAALLLVAWVVLLAAGVVPGR